MAQDGAFLPGLGLPFGRLKKVGFDWFGTAILVAQDRGFGWFTTAIPAAQKFGFRLV